MVTREELATLIEAAYCKIRVARKPHRCVCADAARIYKITIDYGAGPTSTTGPAAWVTFRRAWPISSTWARPRRCNPGSLIAHAAALPSGELNASPTPITWLIIRIQPRGES